MFKKEIRAIVAGSDHFIRRLLHEPDMGLSCAPLATPANYVLALPPDRSEHCNRWRRAARLLLDQANVAEVSHQVHLALFYDAQLDIGAMGT